MYKWYVFMTERVAKWAIELFNLQEANSELPKTEFDHHPDDKRIIWVRETSYDDVQSVQEQFEQDVLAGMERDLYAIIPLPPIEGYLEYLVSLKNEQAN